MNAFTAIESLRGRLISSDIEFTQKYVIVHT